MAEDDNTQPQAENTGGKRRRRPPVTIDLKAEPEVAAAAPGPGEGIANTPPPVDPLPPSSGPEAEAPSASGSEAPPPPKGAPGWLLPLATAIVGGIVGGLLVSFLTAPANDTVTAASIDSRFATLASRLDALEAARSADQGPSTEARRLDALEAELATLRAAPAAQGSAPDLGPLENRIAALEQRPAAEAAPAVDLSPMEGRIAELSERLAALQQKPPVDPKTEAAAHTIAVTALRQAAASGAPFEAELQALRSLGGGDPALDGLADDARTGVPSLAALQAAFPAVADAVRAASMKADPEAGILDRLAASAGSLVSVRPTGPVEGSSTTAIVSRMESAVAGGDLASALAESDGLDPASKAPLEGWAASVRARLALDAALGRLAAGPSN